MVILTSNQTLVCFVLLPENYIGPNLLQFADNLEKAGTTQYSFDSVTTPCSASTQELTWLFV